MEEVVCLLPNHAAVAIDFTIGGAGHATEILRTHPELFLWGVDRDGDALKAAAEKLQPFKGRFQLIHSRFSEASRQLFKDGIKADFILADLGVSSFQLDKGERGFSFRKDASLDMRMDRESPLSAYELVNSWSESELISIFRKYGEEPFARKIAQQIVRQRSKSALLTTQQLSDCIREAVPKKFQYGKLHPATRTFQAIRIAVNQEMEELNELLTSVIQLLQPNGRLAAISFHSLEDRQVKQTFHAWENPCQCPKNIPYCICGLKPVAKTLKPKLIKAGPDEVKNNPRSRSAKLRATEKQ
jgi:16S rRNA (cytosine1402-N4)-methyltransferase